MRYKDAYALIKEDYGNYAIHHVGGGKVNQFLKVLIHEHGFRFLLFLRLTCVKSFLRPFFWLFYRHYSTKFGIQISTRTPVGGGLYLGHGLGVIVNGSATIGRNVTISQFCTIGSSKGKAATIEDGVYIGPHSCLVEDVTIGENAIIGAGSVVVKDLPANCIAAGNPCKVIKVKNEKTQEYERI